MEKYVWFEGSIVNQSSSFVQINNHSFHYGTGVFEGIRSYQVEEKAKIFALDEHMSRLFGSAEIMRIKVGFSQQQIASACYQILAANKIVEGYLRPIIYIDDQYMAATNSNGVGRVAIICDARATSGQLQEVKAISSSLVRPRSCREFYQAKTTGAYGLVHYAMKECAAENAQQAVFLDDQGMVCECLTDNIFMVRRGVVCTPPTYLPLLQGITRQVVIALMQEDGYSVLENEFSLLDLVEADEIFTTGTASEIKAIVELNGRQIGSGSAGKVTQRAAVLYREATTMPLSELA